MILLSSTASFAQNAKPLDANDQKALEQTKAMLNDRKQVEAYTKTNKEAASADQQVNALMGGNSADSAEVYKLSSDIFDKLAQDSGGDPAAMQKILADAMKNPSAFAQKLSPEQRAKLGELAGKAEAVKPSASRP